MELRPTPALMPVRRPSRGASLLVHTSEATTNSPTRPKSTRRCSCGAVATERMRLGGVEHWYCYPCS